MINVPDRLKELLDESQKNVVGIDFVYVNDDQVTLNIHFHGFPEKLEPNPLVTPEDLTEPLVTDLSIDQILIYNPSGGTTLSPIPVSELKWELINDRPVLRLKAKIPGDFTLYRLSINDQRIDLYFNDVTFSFKANCKSELDCKPPEHECPPEDQVDFPVDYRARDFFSFRRALLDFASQRYPDWQDRLEADASVMLLEVMSALGDELAYYQDRVGREAYLETATQRQSLRRHARLVDYHIHDGLGASGYLDVTVKTGQNGSVPAGMEVWAITDKGVRIDYEVGWGLEEVYSEQTDGTLAPKQYEVDSKRNSFQPHIWDEDDTCLFVRTTEMFIKGHHASNLLFDDLPPGKTPGKLSLLKTNPKDPAIPARAFIVRLIEVEDTTDPVFNENITRLVWEDEQALPFEIDLTILEVRGNIVPVTAGKTEQKHFVIGKVLENVTISDDQKKLIVQTVEREGPNGTVAYLFSLPDSDVRQLVWLGNDTRTARPEIRLTEGEFNSTALNEVEEWQWRRSLLGTFSSQSQDRHFTLDDGTWRRVVGFQRSGQEIVHIDYASGSGFTIRFGDGEFGLIPPEGTIFQVSYRLDNGRRGNIAVGSLTRFDPKAKVIQAPNTTINAEDLVEEVNNPLPIENGIDPETPTEVRQLAPEAFRAITFRAVRPEDYAEAAERLPFVQRAGAAFRWTGSWLSAFVTPDPRGAVIVSKSQRSELIDQLDRFRQAGREAHVLDPRYVDLDLEIIICVAPDAFRGDVKEGVLEALLGTEGIRPRPGFFSPDNFTFGTPLKRSTLEAVIQSVPGVRAVEGMRISRRGSFEMRDFIELCFEVGLNEIIRLENDPLHPEMGSLRLIMEGGA